MPSTSRVTEQLTDIVVRVLGVDPDEVHPDATLAELGADSLTVVEIGEELGRRFDVYLTDDTIDHLRTVKDAIAAVTRHDGSGPRRHDAPPVPGAAPLARSVRPDQPVEGQPVPVDADEAWSRARKAGWWLAGAGAVVGVIVGLSFSMLMAASGLDDVSLPPLPVSTTQPTPTETPTDDEEAEAPDPAPEDVEPDEEPTLQAESERVAPGQRFVLSGAFPSLGPDESLQIQVKEPGTDWEDFPVVSRTRENGQFRSEIFTSRAGEREFRLYHADSDTTTPSVTVTIG